MSGFFMHSDVRYSAGGRTPVAVMHRMCGILREQDAVAKMHRMCGIARGRETVVGR